MQSKDFRDILWPPDMLSVKNNISLVRHMNHTSESIGSTMLFMHDLITWQGPKLHLPDFPGVKSKLQDLN